MTRFDMDMDGSMEPSEHGQWVLYEDVQLQQEQLGEPVGYTDEHGNAYQYGYTGPKFAPNIQLYTTPYVPTQNKPWVGLTDEEMHEIIEKYMTALGLGKMFIDEVEAKLKEKNT